MSARKFVAACLRLFAFANLLYMAFSLVTTFPMLGLSFRILLIFGTWAALSFLLFLYAIPLSKFLADDIDRS
jgi:hypothetical protein